MFSINKPQDIKALAPNEEPAFKRPQKIPLPVKKHQPPLREDNLCEPELLTEDGPSKQSTPSKEPTEFYRDPFLQAEVGSCLSFDCADVQTQPHPNPALACKAFRQPRRFREEVHQWEVFRPHVEMNEAETLNFDASD